MVERADAFAWAEYYNNGILYYYDYRYYFFETISCHWSYLSQEENSCYHVIANRIFDGNLIAKLILLKRRKDDRR